MFLFLCLPMNDAYWQARLSSGTKSSPFCSICPHRARLRQPVYKQTSRNHRKRERRREGGKGGRAQTTEYLSDSGWRSRKTPWNAPPQRDRGIAARRIGASCDHVMHAHTNTHSSDALNHISYSGLPSVLQTVGSPAQTDLWPVGNRPNICAAACSGLVRGQRLIMSLMLKPQTAADWST